MAKLNIAKFESEGINSSILKAFSFQTLLWYCVNGEPEARARQTELCGCCWAHRDVGRAPAEGSAGQWSSFCCVLVQLQITSGLLCSYGKSNNITDKLVCWCWEQGSRPLEPSSWRKEPTQQVKGPTFCSLLSAEVLWWSQRLCASVSPRGITHVTEPVAGRTVLNALPCLRYATAVKDSCWNRIRRPKAKGSIQPVLLNPVTPTS